MNKDLFNTKTPNTSSNTTVKNAAGGVAFKLTDSVALAKYAVSGTFNNTYQMDAKEQLDKILELTKNVSPEFIAKLAVYSRQCGKMKDMPAMLLAILAKTNLPLFKKIFTRVIDNSKMLRNFVMIMRSGVINGSRSFGSAPRNLIREYLNNLTDEQLFFANVGQPSLCDIIKLVRPKPTSKEREALYRYLIGKSQQENKDNKNYLLPIVQQFEAFKNNKTKDVPNVPFMMLTSLPLTVDTWKRIALNTTFTQARMNLNTFARHGVLQDKEIVNILAQKLSDPEEIRKSRVLPYQLFITFKNLVKEIPIELTNALQSAIEISLENVPNIDGDIIIALDVSGSMNHKITGFRGSASSVARYIDAASLFAVALMRKNKNAKILPFDTRVHDININAYDSIITNTKILSSIRGGGTDCSVALKYINDNKIKTSCLIIISDNQSWVVYNKRLHNNTGMMQEWDKIIKNNSNAKLINIDISPSDTTQSTTTPNTLLVGGFSDTIFDVISGFIQEPKEINDEYWLNIIDEIRL